MDRVLSLTGSLTGPLLRERTTPGRPGQGGTLGMTALTAALDYLRRGWQPIPVPHRSKKPALKGWPDLRLTAADLARHFNGQPSNLGILLGEPSGGLVDADLDCARWLANGLDEPKAVMQATAAYRKSQEPLTDF